MERPVSAATISQPGSSVRGLMVDVAPVSNVFFLDAGSDLTDGLLFGFLFLEFGRLSSFCCENGRYW